jgi:hypothetical protein
VKSAYGGVLRRLVAYSLDCGLLAFGLPVLQAILLVVNPIVALMRTGQQPNPPSYICGFSLRRPFRSCSILH